MPSTVIASYDYDPDTSVLRVRFVSGLVYEYQQVPLEIFQAMKKAFSKGTFLNQQIKGNYPFRRVELGNQ